MTKTNTQSIIFITGAFLAHRCWDQWIMYFEDNGYTCIAPPWPGREMSSEELRNRHPDAAIASNDLQMLTDHYANIIGEFNEPPILIGHSLGGLIVQLLLQRGIGMAGVAIHSFPPGGVISFKFSLIKQLWYAMGLYGADPDSYLISFRRWKYTIANGLSCENEKESFYNYAIPESRLIIREVFFSCEEIDFRKQHAPLLLTSGSEDKLIPASLNYKNYKKYRFDNSITDYQNFKGYNHLVFSPSQWLEEADFIRYWLHGIRI